MTLEYKHLSAPR